MNELDCVKIIQLLESERHYDGTEGVKRAPQIGDEGTIVHVGVSDGKTVGYIVESIDSKGFTIWLADFLPDEIQAIV
jgi:hypothetical protein